MRRSCFVVILVFGLLAAVLMVCGSTPAFGQESQGYSGGLVDDWTHHHVIFSNPGTVEDALRNATYEKWRRIVSDPRYRMQEIRRSGAFTVQQTAAPSIKSGAQPLYKIRLPRAPKPEPPNRYRHGWNGKRRMPLHADWSVPDASASNVSVALDMYPAKFTFNPTASPDCTNDFVIFPVNASGKAQSQANIIGVNNLYASPTCSGSVPTVLFAYFVGTGAVVTSPVLSEDGTKVAFVESDKQGGAIFHVLTLDKSGNSGCPDSSPCNGTAFDSTANPGTNNSAVDITITMSGGVPVTRSSPFVDYANDIAYVGDDDGNLHKFTGVFFGTPAEEISVRWPFPVAVSMLGAPVYDSVSGNIFVGSADGALRCVTSAGANCSTAFLSVASGTTPGAVLAAPIVDSTAQTVFATASNSTVSVLLQATTALDSPVRATMGMSGTDLYDGAFDNAYFTNVSTGHMYFCGNAQLAATPTLWRVTFNSNGTMSDSNDGNSFQLVASGNTGTSVDCTPLTEVFNTSQNKDYLFVGVKNNGFIAGPPSCLNQTCVMSFVLPTSPPFTFPAAANTTLTTNLGPNGTSAMIIDNVSDVAGASQLYFGDLQNSTVVQVSQSALQ